MNNKNSVENLEELFRYFVLTEENMSELEKSGIIAHKMILNRNNSNYLLVFTKHDISINYNNNDISKSSIFVYRIIDRDGYRYEKV